MPLSDMPPTIPHPKTLPDLGRLWDEGIASGAPADGEAAFARIALRLAAAIQARSHQLARQRAREAR